MYTLVQLLLAYVSIQRYEGSEVDKMIAENDARTLYKAGEKRLGTDERTFIRIFSERSRAHLAAVDAAYRGMYGHSLGKVFSIFDFVFSFNFSTKICITHLIILAGCEEGNLGVVSVCSFDNFKMRKEPS